ncbi:insulin receptor substrate 1-like [Ambystoma mexicanum]|uniref:insulin receptor substrate 1-like n=1 Tax=Ambystoma mexicanum TaxID=8296 RepID=UPI0037E703B7
MENLPPEPCFADVHKCGYLRKQKSMHRRFFVLRGPSERGPARLEYYESEKKFRATPKAGGVGPGSGGPPQPPPKRTINLETALNVNKRADAKHRHLLVLYSRDSSFCVACEGEEEQEAWYSAMLELQCKGKAHSDKGDDDITPPGPAFKEVWQVSLRPKGLGQAKNLVGIYRLCLTEKTINFVKLSSDAAAVVLQLMNIRRCGHSENYFFIEVGRSAVTGPGEFWMQVEDSVVAQNMHETILEAMKAMSEAFRLRSKSQSLPSNPISVPSRRHHANPPPSQVGFSRRSRVDVTANTSPAAKHNFQRVRTASDGNGSASRPASEDGSPASTTPTLRVKSQKNPGGNKPCNPPSSHTKSTPVPSARPTSLPNPVSPSSSSTSGHGSDCHYTHTLVNSISESPSDYGFISSDECGSSPGDLRTPYDPMNFLPASLDDSSLNYISMGKQGLQSQDGQCQRKAPKWASGKGGEGERNLNKRASLPPMSVGRVTPKAPRKKEGEEYTMMTRTPSRESFTASTSAQPSSYSNGLDPGQCETLRENEKIGMGITDNGYMAMLPGGRHGSQGKSDDYMPMTPNSVSPPQHIVRTEVGGYMVMSPNGSCSPDNAAYRQSWMHGEKFSVDSNDSKMSVSEYMNMSPLSCSASSTPPDTSPHLADDAPKMIYSYYSLPRSYKHTATATVRPFTACAGSTRHSCSSSTSSDSLEDPEHVLMTFGPPKIESAVPLKRGKGRPPVNLFIDVSKANTLPKVRENPAVPPAPKSPGEYVSIEFRTGSARPLPRPTSCISGFHTLPAIPLPSEYMNMDLDPPTGFSRRAARPLGVSEPKRKPFGATAEECLNVKGVVASSTSIGSPTFSDYTEMAFGTGAETPKSSSPIEQETTLRESDLMEHIADIGTFSVSKLSPNPNQGAKLIRVDPQGRRRHCSETFLSVPATVASLSVPFSDHAKRHSSASFENVWTKGEAGASAAAVNGAMAAVPDDHSGSLPRHPSGGFESGLNYIDLDLAKDGSQEGPSVQPKPFAQFHVAASGATGGVGGAGSAGSSIASLNTYASIDFHKSEELRSHKTTKDGTEC